MIPSERAHLLLAAHTHPGMSGKDNEDRYGISAFFASEQQKIPVVLAVMADGIGGHKAGEIAAELAVETISEVVASGDVSQPVDLLIQAIVQAGQSISEKAEVDIAYRGMGSTCACALVVGSRLYIASVGDSRIYLIRGNKIQQLTTDHTWIQEAIDHGAIKPGQAHNHPNAHVIRRYLGSRQEVVPDTRLRLNPAESDGQAVSNQGLYLHPGDLIFLCSDGLTDLVNNTEILTAFKGQGDQAVLESLVELANQRGGHDNITVLSMRLPVQARGNRWASFRDWLKSRRRLALACGVVFALLIIGALAAGGYYWLSNRADRQIMPTSTTFARQLTPAIGGTTMPGAAPDVFSSTQSLPGDVEDGSAVPAATQPTSVVSTPMSVTLTPWPTNTLEP
ncbi:MAG: serine/threonine-protein phosphatase [Anaerolineales bacterium]|nr:MAG: serine/threonine-protein phosphatase [Anaerolineales bacterium]